MSKETIIIRIEKSFAKGAIRHYLRRVYEIQDIINNGRPYYNSLYVLNEFKIRELKEEMEAIQNVIEKIDSEIEKIENGTSEFCDSDTISIKAERWNRTKLEMVDFSTWWGDESDITDVKCTLFEKIVKFIKRNK